MNCTGKTLYKSCVKTLYIPVHVLDVDECDLRTDNCDNNALCTNTPGGFTCDCQSGFVGDGVDCNGKSLS